MPTVRLIVRYDGTSLSGWQRQRGVRTVQEELERAASVMARETVRVHGAGRTDAGVHALAQVAAFHTNATIPMKGWLLGLTSNLPPEIAIREAREVPDGYDPRRASGGKRYRYLILNERMRDPLLRDRAWLVYDSLDVNRMRETANQFVGWHDFKAFRAADCERIATVRHMYRVAIVEGYGGRDGMLALEVEGTAFLKNMVRIITGTLVDIGRGRLDPGVVAKLLAGEGTRGDGGITAPPQGLYLDEVFVRPEHRLADDTLKVHPGYANAQATWKPTGDDESVDEGG